MSVNKAEAPGNTAQASPGAAAVAFPPLIVVPGSPGYAALALMAVPVALWALMVLLSTKRR
ncbi:hypothetical protein ACIQWZ_37235 [Streptomyces sp. NPDC098077]|uniref:hypothetical protein n=1 Tax=Streptomyces TaxID=1883 RepID=UPI0022566187|nr:hypothetical protein [Streptomyces anulatus]MCX4523859.1 hypothetical protein [Streptomyces anulatus]MCX4606631.1 hypothetical protein [Streptomyces anulatus]WSU79041.1 hypothetical protein OG499_39450 [Streptomyces anulatus]WTD15268.1 hypothetical protein OHA54_39020 [Streptomyces anulatus]WTE08680.1 hypothetical protein OH765_39715 [Streptomyces anulatus]